MNKERLRPFWRIAAIMTAGSLALLGCADKQYTAGTMELTGCGAGPLNSGTDGQEVISSAKDETARVQKDLATLSDRAHSLGGTIDLGSHKVLLDGDSLVVELDYGSVDGDHRMTFDRPSSDADFAVPIGSIACVTDSSQVIRNGANITIREDINNSTSLIH